MKAQLLVTLSSAVLLMLSQTNRFPALTGAALPPIVNAGGIQAPQPVAIGSSCLSGFGDAGLNIQYSTEQSGRVFKWFYTPSCFPKYYYKQPHFEGMFMENGQPLPVMGRTSGHFNLLIVFIDSASNRQRLLQNTGIPAAMKARISKGEVKGGLEDLFAAYTTESVLRGLLGTFVPSDTLSAIARQVSFSFTVALSSLPRANYEGGATEAGEKLGFPEYDAVVLLDEFPAAGFGVHRWPGGITGDFNNNPRPLFYGKKGTFILTLHPQFVTPGLFGNELLRRNLPLLPSEYTIGPPTTETIGNTVYDRTPLINPRTGENLEPVLRAGNFPPFFVLFGGYADIDHDGILDCVDPTISPTADNVDGDFLPDRLDPSLSFKHTPLFWVYKE